MMTELISMPLRCKPPYSNCLCFIQNRSEIKCGFLTPAVNLTLSQTALILDVIFTTLPVLCRYMTHYCWNVIEMIKLIVFLVLKPAQFQFISNPNCL